MKCFPSPHITLLVSLLNVPCTGKVSHAKESQHEKMYLQKHYYIKADHNFCMEETLFKKELLKLWPSGLTSVTPQFGTSTITLRCLP